MESLLKLIFAAAIVISISSGPRPLRVDVTGTHGWHRHHEGA